VRLLLRVPVSARGHAEVQVAPLCVSYLLWLGHECFVKFSVCTQLAPRQNPALAHRVRDTGGVAQPRLADAAHFEVVRGFVIVGELDLWLGKRHVIIAEVVVPRIACGAEGVVADVRKPLEVSDEGVCGVLATAKGRQHIFDVRAIRPAPAGRDEPEGVARRDAGCPSELVVSCGACVDIWQA